MSDAHPEPHVCFSCKQPIRSRAPHLHMGFDEWAADNGLQQFGLDDLLTFAFCKACTQPGGRYHLHKHKIAGAS